MKELKKQVVNTTLKDELVRAAVARALRIRCSEKSLLFHRWYNTPGTTPHEPHVGAVTIFPPEAFSSLTARA